LWCWRRRAPAAARTKQRTPRHKALRVAQGDVTKVVPDSDGGGERIHASHIHRELRRVLGVDQADFIKQFPLPAGTSLPLLA
jgi:hypothetical protein